MLWLVQHLRTDSSTHKLVELLDRYGLDYKFVKALSFTNKIVSADLELNGVDLDTIPELEIDDTKPIFVCGSYSLAKIAKKRNWKPGAFLNENFEQSAWVNGWGKERMLNSEYIQSTLGDVEIPWSKFFARPAEDTKSFSGTIFEKENFETWKQKVLDVNSQQLNATTEIIIAPLKKIYIEYRFFIVNGKVSTGSVYKRGDVVQYDSLMPNYVIEYAEELAAIWSPDVAYVLDLADTDEGLKIIEVNNINSSGFYASDLQKFIISIEDLVS